MQVPAHHPCTIFRKDRVSRVRLKLIDNPPSVECEKFSYDSSSSQSQKTELGYTEPWTLFSRKGLGRRVCLRSKLDAQSVQENEEELQDVHAPIYAVQRLEPGPVTRTSEAGQTISPR